MLIMQHGMVIYDFLRNVRFPLWFIQHQKLVHLEVSECDAKERFYKMVLDRNKIGSAPVQG